MSTEFELAVGAARALGRGAYALHQNRKRNRERAQAAREQQHAIDQSSGLRYSRMRTAYGGRKSYNSGKIIRAGIYTMEQQLAMRYDSNGPVVANRNKFMHKTMISDFDPGKGGAIQIAKDSTKTFLPMHVYDLNYYCGVTPDTHTNNPTELISGRNSDVNSRAWVWLHNNSFAPLMNAGTGDRIDPRYMKKDARTIGEPMDSTGTKIYRNNAQVDLMLYGCTKTETEFDVRIIRVLDPAYCPDYRSTLNATDENNPFRQAWQSLVYPYTVNPMLKGIEPGPKTDKRWFSTVCKQRIKIGEQTGDIESVPSVQTRLFAKINEMNNMTWSYKEFNLEQGAQFYDENIAPDDAFEDPAIPDDGGQRNQNTKAWYTSRYYLVIRALTPRDAAVLTNIDQNVENTGIITGDGMDDNHGFNINGQKLSKCAYIPSYDINIITRWSGMGAS